MTTHDFVSDPALGENLKPTDQGQFGEEEAPLSGIVGIIHNGRRFTEAEVREALAKGAQWEAARRAEGEVFPGSIE